MPTKERLKREKERNKLNDVLTPSKKLLEMIPLERLGRVAPYAEVDPNGELYLHPKTGVGGNKLRQDDRQDTVRDLKKKHRDIWGKRGAAKKIAIDKGLNIRTIQKYFKDFP
ncbi:MAG: hypothetical protein Q8L73_00145 [Methylotenera sp.]|nr:hypothetical protein [Methylotenera sp.]